MHHIFKTSYQNRIWNGKLGGELFEVKNDHLFGFIVENMKFNQGEFGV